MIMKFPRPFRLCWPYFSLVMSFQSLFKIFRMTIIVGLVCFTLYYVAKEHISLLLSRSASRYNSFCRGGGIRTPGTSQYNGFFHRNPIGARPPRSTTPPLLCILCKALSWPCSSGLSIGTAKIAVNLFLQTNLCVLCGWAGQITVWCLYLAETERYSWKKHSF